MEHSKVVGGSTAKRVINCPASIELTQNLPKQPESDYASAGTLLHNAAEKCLSEDLDAVDVIGMSYTNPDTGTKLTLDRTMVAEKLQPALDALEELFDKYDVEYFKEETRVGFHGVEGLEGCFGTTDVMASGSDTVIVADFKFGDGVMVKPDDNAQLFYYAAAAMCTPETKGFFKGKKRVIFAIIQPSERNPDDTLSTWETDIESVKAFIPVLRDAVQKGLQGGLTPTAGDHCQFCPALTVCKTQRTEIDNAMRMAPDDILTLSDAMAVVDTVEKWAREVRKVAHEQAELGIEIQGWKLVAKRASRKWIDEDVALEKVRNMKKLLLAEATTMKILSPPQLEKVCKTKKLDFGIFDDYIHSVSSGTTLAKDSDKRAEALPIAALANALNQLV